VGFLLKLRGKKPEVSCQPCEPRSESSIREWLMTHIAAIAQIQPEEVEIDRPFAEFGMDSMQLFQLSGELEKFLGHKVSEIVAWDYPTIAKLSRHLSSPGSEVPVSANIVSEDEMSDMAIASPAPEPQR
jgi:acyl carrier protein